MTRWLLAVLLAFGGLEQAAPTTIIMVRHAEAVPNAGNDPVLTDAGIARAKALALALKDSGVTAVFTTQYQRTILTGEPLALAAKVELSKVPVQGPTDPYVRQLLADIFAKHAGSTVAIVGHSNTVPAFVKALTGADVEIAHDSFDQVFIVTATGLGNGRLIRARY